MISYDLDHVPDEDADDDEDDPVCDECDGTGEGPTEYESCYSCGGTGEA
jgi:RecJ-like exonuclease